MESPQIGVALTCTGMGRWLEEATKTPSSLGRVTWPAQGMWAASFDASAVFGGV